MHQSNIAQDKYLEWRAFTARMDGNTRLCTAAAATAFKESFGADGRPGSYTDIEHCDAIFLYGHNMAETQTVLWARILDRTRAADPPMIVCVDPRRTPVAIEAERTGGVHLAAWVGTNLALPVLFPAASRPRYDTAVTPPRTP
jgi:anaerobic selenocysteine-containing dehydrogenase